MDVDPMIFDRLFRRRPRPPAPLRGAPPVRREKTYSAQTGYVYQYYYEGHRESDRAGRAGQEYVFHISSDRKTSFPLTVFLGSEAVDSWQQGHGRPLTSTEQYAAVKMALFQTFDDQAGLGPANAEVEIDADSIEVLLATLDIG
jgi:hypothetical protein